MPTFTLASYNVEHMNEMFENNQVKPDADNQQRAQNVGSMIQTINPRPG